MVEEGSLGHRAEEGKVAATLPHQKTPCNALPSNPPAKSVLDARYS